MSKIREDEFFSEDNIAESNWFAFDEVGKTIYGTFVEKFEKKGTGNLPDQFVYVLLKEDGSYWNVGLSKTKTFVHDRLKSIVPGQYIGFKFVKEVPPSQKGFSPAKSIVPYTPKDESTGNYLMNEDFIKKTGEEAGTPIEDIPFE